MSRQLIVIMGSGETSPTMVGVHKEVVARAGGGRAVLLDAPYGFQENAAAISAKARAYFARSVGLDVDVDGGLAALRRASWVFSGPGSPTYALERWRGEVETALRDHLRAGRAAIVFASAAACTLGRLTVPVYEIYKAGAPARWTPGLDVLRTLGLDVAVVPHYDNAEGGTHDTRYCYLGERRLSAMERDLPPGVAVLGVDEHTAVIVDGATVEVRGRGAMTVRRQGESVAVPSGEALALDELRALVKGGGTAVRRRPSERPPERDAAAPEIALKDIVLACRERFEEGGAAAKVEAILRIEAAVAEWGADTEEDEGTEWARTIMRGMIVRLGEAAADPPGGPDPLAAAVPALVGVRDELRREARYRLADRLRDALAEGGVELRDTPTGTRWHRTEHERPADDGAPSP
ncbi:MULTISPECIES: hypothetical protein [Actinomadura]|uniref:Cysteinyl-tRNA synthetase n=1 Tax=Actinomadura yumaensis TaxID=111807 RepID=A0ABW2CG43_9ACTN|nr:hypothetical protein [Actinomadura sp. J1-007]MWK34410.1 hypothetical protein [Actinomadura sp. J1-007]